MKSAGSDWMSVPKMMRSDCADLIKRKMRPMRKVRISVAMLPMVHAE